MQQQLLTAEQSDANPTRDVPDYFESIVETVRKPLVVLDAHLRVISANRAFYRTFQAAPEQVEKRPFFNLGEGQWNSPALRNLLESILPRHAVFEDFEVAYETENDGPRIIMLNARQVYRPDRDSTMILLGLEDVTERRRTEERLKIYSDKLESSNRELQHFASVASHDLQEPLRKIQAFGDRLKAKCADALSEEGRDYLERMQKAAGRMQVLINDLLMFSRIETRAQAFVPVDLSEVVREVLSDLEIQLERCGGEVRVGPLPTIEADPLQMRQLTQNLLGNALKYHAPEKPPVVEIYGRVSDGFCQIFVADNGIGFDEKYLDRIFTVFQRLHGRQEYEGTGVGLAVCRKIAERHGGSITARSTEGEGATFIVTLPVSPSRELI